eukprot:CAMPEP_0117858694 /NCGR_PEP_ID=MMETSP0950-20121206/2662_1 /TAXON_ID=44440 /ORGANISM="Chattonella subsalsa, Strain CCMP2191" /LENGTH=142 /DNA_ID=CAMNT_0005708369 /DNA_START=371 /DNA_END=795 /DNA_ORIENTATION=-
MAVVVVIPPNYIDHHPVQQEEEGLEEHKTCAQSHQKCQTIPNELQVGVRGLGFKHNDTHSQAPARVQECRADKPAGSFPQHHAQGKCPPVVQEVQTVWAPGNGGDYDCNCAESGIDQVHPQPSTQDNVTQHPRRVPSSMWIS